MLKEFREFAVKGNVVDMAVGIIIGGAFGGIVNSLVNDVMMPPLGAFIGKMDFSKLALEIPIPPMGDMKFDPVKIMYGKFLNAMISFVIVAFALFLLVKGINRLKREEAAAPAAPPPPTRDQTLLAEIRDLLKTQGR